MTETVYKTPTELDLLMAKLNERIQDTERWLAKFRSSRSTVRPEDITATVEAEACGTQLPREQIQAIVNGPMILPPGPKLNSPS